MEISSKKPEYIKENSNKNKEKDKNFRKFMDRCGNQ